MIVFTTDGLIKNMTTTASEKREKRKLLTLCRSIASFITTNASPHEAETSKSAHGARRKRSAWLELIHATSSRVRSLRRVQAPFLEFLESKVHLLQQGVSSVPQMDRLR